MAMRTPPAPISTWPVSDHDDLHVFARPLREAIRELQRAGADWPPLLVVQGGSGYVHEPITLDGYFQDGSGPQALAWLLPTIIRGAQAQRAAIVVQAERRADATPVVEITVGERGKCATWRADVDTGGRLGAWSPANRPRGFFEAALQHAFEHTDPKGTP